MFGDDRDASIVARGIAEALACQDMLARVPPRPSPLARLHAWIVHLLRGAIDRKPDHDPARRPLIPRQAASRPGER